MLTGCYLSSASFTHRRGQILSKTFNRQIQGLLTNQGQIKDCPYVEHKDCDQVMEKMFNFDECLLTDFVYTCKYLSTHYYQARSA